jgi:hypothetical protein
MEQIIKILKDENPSAKESSVRYYATLLNTYFEAENNINKNGVIVAHPRTGAPIENPYHKIFLSVGKAISTCRLKLDKAIMYLKSNEDN